MSTSSFPFPVPASRSDFRERAAALARGREDDPWWSRPGLILVTVIAAVLIFWSLTISGDANDYYAGGALAATQSWHALFFNAADLSGFTTLDKGPLSDWLMGISGRLFGFSSFTMLLPEALCGVGAVVLLHNVVRRTLGHRAALLAALLLAISPVSLVMARYNNPDALLALLLVASAWALVRALESGRRRHLMLCAVLVGLAFETKMLEAYVIVPGLAIAYLVAASGSVRRRLGELLGAGVVMFAVSFSWFGLMQLIPRASRPFVGSTTNDSWFTLIFGYNGLSRLTGGGRGGFGGGGGGAHGGSGELARRFAELAGGSGAGRLGGGGGGGFGTSTGPLRLLSGAGVGGQIGWLLPLALVGLLVGVWVTWRSDRMDRRRAALIMFGLWALASFVVFSFSQGTFHPYYTNAMAPAVAALAAVGGIMLFDRVRAGWSAPLVALVALAATTYVSFQLLSDTPTFLAWLRWVIVAAAVLAVVVGLGLRLVGDRLPRRAACGLALGASAVALLGGPTAYSLATIGHGQTGSNPTAGPASAETSGFGGGKGFAGLGKLAGETGRGTDVSAADLAARFTGAGAGGDRANTALVKYLEAHRDGAEYLVAADGSQTADPIELATKGDVITIGGFEGSDPAPTLSQIKRLVAGGKLHFVLLGGGFGGGAFGGGALGGAAFGGAASDASESTSSLSSLFGTGGGSGAPAAAGASTAAGAARTSGDSSAGTAPGGERAGFGRDSAVTSWVQANCQTVTVPGQSSSASTATRGGGSGDLYSCTRADAANGA